MKKSHLALLAFALLFIFPQVTFAHPNHVPESSTTGIFHLLTEPDHLFTIAGVGVLVGLAMILKKYLLD